MSPGLYRLTAVACALSWFLVGMHSSVFHEIVDHRAVPHWSVLALVALFAVVGAASLGTLVRLGPPSMRQSSGPRLT